MNFFAPRESIKSTLWPASRKSSFYCPHQCKLLYFSCPSRKKLVRNTLETFFCSLVVHYTMTLHPTPPWCGVNFRSHFPFSKIIVYCIIWIMNVFPVLNTIFFYWKVKKWIFLLRRGQKNPLYDPLVNKLFLLLTFFLYDAYFLRYFDISRWNTNPV